MPPDEPFRDVLLPTKPEPIRLPDTITVPRTDPIYNCHAYLTVRRPTPLPGGAMSSNLRAVRTSFSSFASERGMAGVWRFRTAASAVPTIAAMNRSAR